MPVIHNGEKYLTAAEASKHLGISRDTFYRSVKARLEQYNLGVFKRPFYKQSDLDALQGPHPVEKPDETR
jgi:hypothetical protein